MDGGDKESRKQKAVQLLTSLLLYDYDSDLKLKDVTLVDAYYKWNKILQNMSENKCHGCIKLDEHMKLFKEIFKHREEVNELKFQMSDKALQQMPDFQGRV